MVFKVSNRGIRRRFPASALALTLALAPASVPRAMANDDPFHEDTLTMEALVRTVLERNSEVEAARAAWEAAKAREPQRGAWDDPVFSVAVAPASVGGDRAGYTLALSQKIPFPGKQRLAGAAARAEAEGAEKDLEDLRLDLAVQAAELFAEYYALTRSLEINGEFLQLWERYRSSAQARYRSGSGSPQDPLQAEAGRIETRIEGERLRARLEATRARIHALLHLSREAALPPPPGELPSSEALQKLPADSADAAWLVRHPDYRAVEARIRAAGLSTEWARRNRWPDFQVSLQRNAMWPDPDMRTMVGVSAVLPLQWGSRKAAVSEADARLRSLEQGHHRHADQLKANVRARAAELEEAERWPELYRDTLLPVLEARVEAARTGYKTDRNDFFVLIQAEKALRETRLAWHVSLAEHATRRARLQAALGRIPFSPSSPSSPFPSSSENNGGNP